MLLLKQLFPATRGPFPACLVSSQFPKLLTTWSSQKHNEQRSSRFRLPVLMAAPLLAVSLLLRSNENERKKANGWLPVVNCAEAIPPKQLPKERLAAIKSLDFVADVVEEVSPAVVSVTSGGNYFQINTSMGSGFIVDDTGLVITNAHVVGRQQAIKIRTQDGRDFDAAVLAMDVNSDLALVQMQGDAATLAQLPRLPMAPRSQMPRPGQFVIAVGSPLMLSNTVTVGVISAVERDLGHRGGLKYLQTDAIITFGNSGGPLVNLYGEVVGVNTMVAETGLGFAIPTVQLQRFIEVSKKALSERGRSSSPNDRNASKNLSNKSPGSSGSWSWFGGHEDKNRRGGESGSVVVGGSSVERHSRYLGLVLRTLTPELAAQMMAGNLLPALRDLRGGVLIHGVIRGSPAERSGLLPGDIITEVNGQPVVNASEIFDTVENSDSLSMTILRHGKTLSFDSIQTESV